MFNHRNEAVLWHLLTPSTKISLSVQLDNRGLLVVKLVGYYYKLNFFSRCVRTLQPLRADLIVAFYLIGYISSPATVLETHVSHEVIDSDRSMV